MRYLKKGVAWLLCLLVIRASAQQLAEPGDWECRLYREDGKVIRFHFDLKKENTQTVLYLVNAKDRFRVEKIRISHDSVWIEMPVFESVFRARRESASRWEGSWIRQGALKTQVIHFVAETQRTIAPKVLQPASTDISGRWSVGFQQSNGEYSPAIGEWQQKGNDLQGTFLTPTGDYRYLSGFVDGDSMHLYTFDGSHAYYFTAHINHANELNGGIFYSGATAKESWKAVRNAQATLPDLAAMYLKNGEERLNFRFKDLTGKYVSINDAKFANKVVIVQIMGSWCPNCMDETAFLSEYYRKNKSRGVEIIGLAYEYSTDEQRSARSIRKFKERFNVQYTLLNTGVTVSDSLRTEKTLPQLTPIKSFPSTIFIGKDGRVAQIKAGFEGPGTGIHYVEMKKEFEATVRALLDKK